MNRLKRIAVLILLLLVLPFGLRAGQLYVTSLPYNVTQATHSASLWDTITIAGYVLTSPDSGLTFSSGAHHWLVLLRSGTTPDTIVFGTNPTPALRPDGNVARVRGIAATSANNIIIRGGVVLHRPSNIAQSYDGAWLDEANTHNLAIMVSGNNILIDSMKWIETRGSSNVSVSYEPATISISGYNNTIRDCDSIVNRFYAYRSREAFQACAIRSTGDVRDLPNQTTDWNLKLIHCGVRDYAHAAIYAYGASVSGVYYGHKIFIDSCTGFVDSRNNRYTTFSGTGGSNTNAYWLVGTYLAGGSKIRWNNVTTGSTYLGGRAIMLVRSVGTDANRIEVAYNHAHTNEGYNVEFGNSPGDYNSNAVRLRQHCSGIWLHHNAMCQELDTMQSISVHGQACQPSGIAFTYEQAFDYATGATPPYYITIENNVCSLLVRTNVNVSRYNGAATNWIVYAADPTLIVRNNRQVSFGDYVVDYGRYDGGGSDVHLYGDTLELKANNLPRKSTFNVGFSSYNYSQRNTATDCVYLGSATGTASGVSYYNATQPTSSGTQNMRVQQTLNVKIIDFNDNPLSNATVTATDAYARTHALGTTGVSGVASGVLSTLFADRVIADSTAFDPYTLTITRTNRNGVLETQTKAISLATLRSVDTVLVPMSQVDLVVADRSVGAASSWSALGIPREMIFHYKADTFVFISNGVHRVTGYGTGAVTTLTNSQIFAYDHNHAELRNDTLWVFSRRVATYLGNAAYMPPNGLLGSDTCWVNLWRISGASPTLLASGKIGTGAGWPPSHYDVNFNISGGHIGAASQMLALVRYGGNSSPTQNVLYYTSNNNGLTWTCVGTIPTPMIQNVYVRFDLDQLHGSSWGALQNEQWGVVFSYQQATQRFYSATYDHDGAIVDGGTFWSTQIVAADPQTFSASLTVPCWQRTMSTQSDTSGWLHIAWFDNAVNSHVLHAYRRAGTTSWTLDTVETLPYQMLGAEGYTAMSFNEKYNRLHLFFTRRLSGTANNNALVTTQWSNSARMFGPKQVLGAATGVIAMAGSQPFATTVDSCRSALLYTSGTTTCLMTLIDTTAGAPIETPHIDTTLVIDDASAWEPDTLVFLVTLSPALATNFTYHYQTQDWQARAVWDYFALNADATILAGDTKDTIKVATVNDNGAESTERMYLNLSAFSISGVRNALSDTVGVGWIYDNDVDQPQQPNIGKRLPHSRRLR